MSPESQAFVVFSVGMLVLMGIGMNMGLALVLTGARMAWVLNFCASSTWRRPGWATSAAAWVTWRSPRPC